MSCRTKAPSLVTKAGFTRNFTYARKQNEAAAADAPFARLHCTQEKRIKVRLH